MWRRDFTGSSGVFSVVFGSTLTKEQVFAFLDSLHLFEIGYSWGGVTSLAVPWTGANAKKPAIYGDRLVRLNIGLEDPDDLIADLDRALGQLQA